MPENHVSITAAFSDAWERMQAVLFRPFDLKKWFVLGFTAWLAGLARGGRSFGWSTGGSSDSNDSDLWSSSAAAIAEAARSGAESLLAGAATHARIEWGGWRHWARWPLEHPVWFAAGIFGCFVLLALLLVVLWLSSRGKFMFLDNVVHDRAEVARPWRRYRRVGNSHFAFQLAFIGLFLVLAVATAVLFMGLAWGSNRTFGAPVGGLALLFLVPAAMLVALGVAYVQYFLDGFVVPLMHRYDLGVLDAWTRFGTLFRRHPWALLLSGPFLLLLGFAAMLLVLMAGLLTCCIGLILVIIPYIGTVILLPIPVTYRGFTVALLEQMDPGYFPQDPPETEAALPAG